MNWYFIFMVKHTMSEKWRKQNHDGMKNQHEKKPKSWGKNLHGNTHWEWKWFKKHNNKEGVENEGKKSQGVGGGEKKTKITLRKWEAKEKNKVTRNK